MLTVEGLSKTYFPPAKWLRPVIRTAARRPVPALKDVTFQVDAGQIVGLVGPNGAGKTTLFRVAGTLLEPTAGRAAVDGYDTVNDPDEVRRRIGLVLEGDRGLYGRVTGRENLEFFGVLGGLEPRAARIRAAELLEFVGLASADKLVFGYSAGMRTKLSLARALVADPPLVLLDEPTRSLDPVASGQVGDLLGVIAREGRAVLLSSHRLQEVVATCHDIVVLTEGQVRWQGPPDGLSGPEAGRAEALTSLLSSEVDQT